MVNYGRVGKYNMRKSKRYRSGWCIDTCKKGTSADGRRGEGGKKQLSRRWSRCVTFERVSDTFLPQRCVQRGWEATATYTPLPRCQPSCCRERWWWRISTLSLAPPLRGNSDFQNSARYARQREKIARDDQRPFAVVVMWRSDPRGIVRVGVCQQAFGQGGGRRTTTVKTLLHPPIRGCRQDSRKPLIRHAVERVRHRSLVARCWRPVSWAGRWTPCASNVG
jgi:hypothetical protein